MLCLALFMKETTVIFRNVMRFPRLALNIERNNKRSYADVYYAFATIPSSQLDLTQPAYAQRYLICCDSRKTTISKFEVGMFEN